MRRVSPALVVVLLVSSPTVLLGQQRGGAPGNGPGAEASIPRLIRLAGTLRTSDGRPLAQVETITLRVYGNETSDTVLWEETQHVIPDRDGRYSVLLGSTRPDGVPLDVFRSGEARWVGVTLEGPGERESARMRLVSVPYALRASDADTLGGLPASAFVRATDTANATRTGTTAAVDDPTAILPGTPTALAKYSTATDLVSSSIFALGNGLHGVNTAAPRDAMHVQFTNTSGSLTGYAVQNLGNTATSYSGTLFYDHNGVLGQFQGFNNITHEYRINNVARNGSSVFDGTINFMVGGTSRFFVGSTGNVGVGTTTPGPGLEVSNALTTNLSGNILATSYGDVAGGSLFVGRKFRGTSVAPAPVQANDTLAVFGGSGRGTSTLGPITGSMRVWAAETFTETARGTHLAFFTTPIGSATTMNRMMIRENGDIGMGTFFPPGGALEVSRTGADTVILNTSYDGEPVFMARAAGGTPAAPLAVTEGSELGVFAAGGFDGNAFNNGTAGIAVFAAEDWTTTATGSALGFYATPVGTIEPQLQMAILSNGFVGIGVPDAPGGPVVLDRLQVFGDLRVGTSDANGCVKSFDGTALIGVCASDARFKTNVASFDSMLAKVSALRPVHYDWRTSEFPDRHFSSRRSYGLIAQEVEDVLPELVVTNADGYKAVDYTRLPLLAVQAIKELKAENDALQARLAELERMMNEVLAGRR